MKKAYVLVAALIFAFSTFALALDITMDAQKDAFYETLTGPEDGWIYLDPATAWDPGLTAPDDEYDLSAFIWIAWDSSYFYLYTEVNDEYVTVNNAEQPYFNDALELKIDPDPNLSDETTTGVAAYRLTALSEDEAEVPEQVQNINSGEADSGDWETVAGEDYARAETDLGYNLELRIPFEAIVKGERYASGEVGWVMGMATNTMDNDEGTREHVLRWASDMNDAVWNDPWRHGTLTFLEGNKINMSTENYITGLDTNTVDYSIPAGVFVASNVEAPVTYELAQNYPNPFNPTTTISYSLAKAGHVELTVFDLLGEQVASLTNEIQEAGVHNVTFDASNLTSGVYFYTLRTEGQTFTNKMMLMK